MDEDRTALEQLDLIVPICGHLPERLLAEIVRGARVQRIQQPDPVRAADLLQRPADAQVAYQALSEARNPAVGRDFGGCSRVDWHFEFPLA